jgi:N-acetylneuraminate synthase
MYPCPPERWGLNELGRIKARYACPVGFSDHSGGVFAGLAAATLGAELLEVHVVFSRACFGPDVSSSVTLGEFGHLVRGVAEIDRARASLLGKDAISAELSDVRRLFGKSIVAIRELPAGHRLSPEDLGFKKPGTGIPSTRVAEVIGRALRRAIAANQLIAEDDLE